MTEVATLSDLIVIATGMLMALGLLAMAAPATRKPRWVTRRNARRARRSY